MARSVGASVASASMIDPSSGAGLRLAVLIPCHPAERIARPQLLRSEPTSWRHRPSSTAPHGTCQTGAKALAVRRRTSSMGLASARSRASATPGSSAAARRSADAVLVEWRGQGGGQPTPGRSVGTQIEQHPAEVDLLVRGRVVHHRQRGWKWPRRGLRRRHALDHRREPGAPPWRRPRAGLPLHAVRRPAAPLGTPAPSRCPPGGSTRSSGPIRAHVGHEQPPSVAAATQVGVRCRQHGFGVLGRHVADLDAALSLSQVVVPGIE